MAMKTVGSLFGLPISLIADQGRSFASSGFREFCTSQIIDLHLIATGASRANGQVERVIGTPKSMLTAVEMSQRSWQDALLEVQLAVNSTAYRVTKISPLELMIGREVRPFCLLPITDNEKIVDKVRLKAKENIVRNAQYDKKRFYKNMAILVKHHMNICVPYQILRYWQRLMNNFTRQLMKVRPEVYNMNYNNK